MDKMTPHLALLGTVLVIDDFATATVNEPGSLQTKCLTILRHWLNVTPNATWKLFCDKLKKNETFNNLRARIAQDHGVSGVIGIRYVFVNEYYVAADTTVVMTYCKGFTKCVRNTYQTVHGIQFPFNEQYYCRFCFR